MIEIAKIVQFTCARSRVSHNHSERRAKHIIGVVLHHTGGSDEGSESWMENRASDASCHIHIRRDGSTTRMVADNRKAWHAGVSEWRGMTDVGAFTLGWEIGNLGNGREPYTDLQYGVLAQKAVHYIRQGLTLDDFTSHANVARPVGRKNDPLAFDWSRFRRETKERLSGVGSAEVEAQYPHRVYSGYFKEYLIVTRYGSDNDWSFVRESDVNKLPSTVAGTPLSRMPLSK